MAWREKRSWSDDTKDQTVLARWYRMECISRLTSRMKKRLWCNVTKGEIPLFLTSKKWEASLVRLYDVKKGDMFLVWCPKEETFLLGYGWRRNVSKVQTFLIYLKKAEKYSSFCYHKKRSSSDITTLDKRSWAHITRRNRISILFKWMSEWYSGGS